MFLVTAQAIGRSPHERDPDPDAWVRALGVRGARPDAEAKDEQLLVSRTSYEKKRTEYEDIVSRRIAALGPWM